MAAGIGFVSLSCEVSPLPRFVAGPRPPSPTAYLTPAIRAYARGLGEAVGGAPLYFMTSAGALVHEDAFRGS